ncbi:hypothetical protein KKE78_05395 [Patescibacteria group bacterium]|nr:hypothetical protein [Patescibacteria group bacterium]
MGKIQKGFAAPAVPAVVVVLILAVAGVFYLNRSSISKVLPTTPSVKITPSAVPTISEVPQSNLKIIQYTQIPGWQKYDNVSGGYSIQYDPKLYKIEDKDETNLQFTITDSLKLVCIPQPTLKTCGGSLQINNYSDYNGESRRQWLTASSAHASETPLYYEEVGVGNTRVLIGMSENYTYVMVPQGSQMILISTNLSFFNTQKQKPVNLEFIYQILSTFKFLD